MKITFKEVGQGDSMIIEWENDIGASHVGIIDCNLKEGGLNPVLDYFKSKSNYQVDFIILTHPHHDHFSGLNDLLLYFEANSIPVGLFLHTSENPSYLLAAVEGVIAKTEITRLFKTVHKLYTSRVINDYVLVNNQTREFTLWNGWKLRFMGPSRSEVSIFHQRVFKGSFEDKININKSDANLLCTFIKIYKSDSFAILTSDVVSEVFRRIQREGFQDLRKSMIFGQVPHHGSAGNFHATFWRIIERTDGCRAIISVGDNSYGHPSKQVIDKLAESNYEVYLTNTAHVTPIALSKAHDLDLFSDATTTTASPHAAYSSISKDITYDFESDTFS